jgi:hypothetical protein
VPSLPPAISTCPSRSVVAESFTRGVEREADRGATEPVLRSIISAVASAMLPSDPPTISTRLSMRRAAA